VILAAGGRIWTGAFLRSSLVALDPARARIARRPKPEIGIGLTGLAVHGRSLWAIASRARRLVRLDARTGRQIGDAVPLPGASNAVAATRDAVWVVVTTPGISPPNQLLRIDPETHEVVDSREITYGVRRLAVAAGGLWMLASNPARLVRIDLETRKRRSIELEADSSVDLTFGEGALWATLGDVDQLARIEPRSGRITTYAVGRGPAGVEIHDGSAWVANRASSTLTRLDVRTGRVREEIEVPLNPYDVAAGDGAVWLTSLAEGEITRVRAPAG
jgi:streptogramin lyase